jgi:hypothetical protein
MHSAEAPALQSQEGRHSLDAGMPRSLTPCRLWRSSRGRCGFPATPPSMVKADLENLILLQLVTCEHVKQRHASPSRGREGAGIYGAILEEEPFTPDAQLNSTGSYLTDGHRTTARNESSLRRGRVPPVGQRRGRLGRSRAPGGAFRIQPTPGKLWVGRDSGSSADGGAPPCQAPLAYLSSSDRPASE